MIIIIFALVGGGTGFINLYQKYMVPVETIDTNLVQGFAAAFVRSYLTVEGGKPLTISSYSDLPDQRTVLQGQNNSEIRDSISQKVIGVWPVTTDVLAGNHMNVQLVAVVERIVPNKENYEEQLNRLITYKIDVPVTQGMSGYKVTQYPNMNRIEKDAHAMLPKLGNSDNQAQTGMKPMLLSFFKRYFEGESKEDIVNFFLDTNQVPSPQRGLFLFDQIDQINAYPGGRDSWLVLVNIQVTDKYSNISYPFTYSMNVVRQGDKYLIAKFNE